MALSFCWALVEQNGKTASDYKAESPIVKLMRKQVLMQFEASSSEFKL